MTRQEWLLQLRRCTSKDTLEKIIDKNTGNAVNLLMTILICSHSILVTSG